jgi:hypothetical protein
LFLLLLFLHLLFLALFLVFLTTLVSHRLTPCSPLWRERILRARARQEARSCLNTPAKTAKKSARRKATPGRRTSAKKK